MASYDEQYSVTLPIQSKSLAYAQVVSEYYPQPSLALRVFRNAIAISTVKSYLDLMGIPSSYEQSDLCNPAVQIAADSSDLDVVGVGKLECRWIDTETNHLSVPYEVRHERIGYAFVNFELSAGQATLCGFLPTLTAKTISRAELRSVEFMLQHLTTVAKNNTWLTSATNLTRWLSGFFELEWQAVDVLLPPPSAAWGFRGAATISPCETEPNCDWVYGGVARRAKTLMWQKTQEDVFEQPPESVILVVEINQGTPLSARVEIQVHPNSPSTYLPAQIELSILEPGNPRIIQATSRSIDNYLNLNFRGEPGESFKVQLVHGSYRIVEHFQI